MLAIKGKLKNGKIEMLESIRGMKSADLYIVVIPDNDDSDRGTYKTVHESFHGRVMESEEEFKQIGLSSFFDTEDDKNVDWEDVFGL